MRKWTFEYRPLSATEAHDVCADLEECRASLNGRGNMTATILSNPYRVVATVVDADPEEDETGWSGTWINAVVHKNLFPGMRVSGISVEYDNAKLPIGNKWEMKRHGDEWHNGESRTHFVELHDEAEKCVYIQPLVTCLPSKKMVTISLEVREKYELDFYRRAFMETQCVVERIMFQARAARQLIQAFRSEPKNEGFIHRSIKELYATIGWF
ncbi:hypothetical protein EXS57_01210 [Candidatus Kaiserbacteria bacterium]|nr:hypothetical protein [Candidatus Kaiserbacteria bacterium]